MKRMIALALLLAGVGTVVGGCIFVPVPIWDGHEHSHRHSHDW